jgi:hypothetical protein
MCARYFIFCLLANEIHQVVARVYLLPITELLTTYSLVSLNPKEHDHWQSGSMYYSTSVFKN